MGRHVVAITIGVLLVGACTSQQTDSPEITMPALTGKYWMDVEPSLRQLGWRGALIKEPDIPVRSPDRDRIVRQRPAEGALLAPDGPITVQFGS